MLGQYGFLAKVQLFRGATFLEFTIALVVTLSIFRFFQYLKTWASLLIVWLPVKSAYL
jgi:hypothetical protein